MVLSINNLKNFNNGFLTSVSKLTDSCILKFEKDTVSCIASNNDNTVVYYSNIKQDKNFINDNLVVLNIPDVKKLIKIFSCIEDNNVSLNLENNNLSFSSSYFKFKYHLLEDGIIVVPKINISKIFSLQFNTSFDVYKNELQNILKASTIALDITKLYVYSDTASIFCDFTDNSRHNVDSIAVKITDKFEGDKIAQPVPINFEIIRLVSSIKSAKISVRYNNNLGVFLFDVEEFGYQSKYVVSALVN
jgi:hypothetical protein